LEFFLFSFLVAYDFMVFFPVVVKHVEMIPNTPSMSVMITVLV
jgi:hypothetical protein